MGAFPEARDEDEGEDGHFGGGRMAGGGWDVEWICVLLS